MRRLIFAKENGLNEFLMNISGLSCAAAIKVDLGVSGWLEAEKQAGYGPCDFCCAWRSRMHLPDSGPVQMDARREEGPETFPQAGYSHKEGPRANT